MKLWIAHQEKSENTSKFKLRIQHVEYTTAKIIGIPVITLVLQTSLKKQYVNAEKISYGCSTKCLKSRRQQL